MDKLNKELLRKIEKILDIEFYEWQINYLLDIPMLFDMSITGRYTGKTLAYVIKLLFKDDTPIKVYDLEQMYCISDGYHLKGRDGLKLRDGYTIWFRDYFVHIHQTLNMAGIKTRPVFYSKTEYDEYMNRSKIPKGAMIITNSNIYFYDGDGNYQCGLMEYIEGKEDR
jgi:hypothetical protein